jgi:RNA binding exosome subunit
MEPRYIVRQSNATLHHWWNVIDTETGDAVVAALHNTVPNAEQETKAICSRLNGIGGDPRDLAIVEVRSMLHRINRKINEIQKEVRRKSMTESNLDQALDKLETSATNKVAEDQVVDGLAAQAQDETAETARIQAVADKLDQETTAEQTLVANQTPAPAAPAAPASGDGTQTGN